MIKIIKICVNRWENENRDTRELSVCHELGMDIHVMAKGEETGAVEIVDGYEVHRFSTRPLGQHSPVGLNRMISVFTWAHYARQFHADIISGHDLIALTIGYLSNLFQAKGKRAKLVYDSHEFELGRNAKRNKLSLLCIKWLEGFLMRRCAFSIMVNDSIADEVQCIHRLQARPIVVRNIPNYWELEEASIAQKRTELCVALKVPENTFLLMYHGAVFNNRGIENMLRAVANTERTAFVILGNGEIDYIYKLQTMIEQMNLINRVLFLDAVPIEMLCQYVGAADCGMVLPYPISRNHYFSLPNKFFENIQALSPVIVSNFPEIGRLTRQYGIGLVVDPTNIEEITAAINKMRGDKNFYTACKQNLKTAKEELCWNREQEQLIKAYKRVCAEVQ